MSADSRWRVARLGEVAQITMGQAPPSEVVTEVEQGLPFIQGCAEFGSRSPSPKKWCLVPARRATTGDVLISVRAPVGALNMADQDLAIGRGVAAITFHGVLPEFGWHALGQVGRQLARVAQGSTFQAINRGDLEAVTLAVPPQERQRSIASLLDACDDAIADDEAVVEQLDRVRRELAEELLTRGLPRRQHGVKPSIIGTIPGSWGLKVLADVGQVQTGLAKGKASAGAALELPYLRVANVQDGHVDLEEVKTVVVEPAALERYRLRTGDVLFTEGGDFDKLGRGCVWLGQIDPCLHQNHVFAVRTGEEVLPDFLAAYAASQRGRAYFLDCAKRTTNLASINSTQLKALPVPVPPLAEQRTIVDAIGAVTDRIGKERAVVFERRRLKAALADALLKGKIRVPEARAV